MSSTDLYLPAYSLSSTVSVALTSASWAGAASGASLVTCWLASFVGASTVSAAAGASVPVTWVSSIHPHHSPMLMLASNFLIVVGVELFLELFSHVLGTADLLDWVEHTDYLTAQLAELVPICGTLTCKTGQ